MMASFRAPLRAGEYVVLGNGFRLYATRHEIEGSVVRVFSSGGIAEIPAASVLGYELEDLKPEVPAPSTSKEPSPASLSILQAAPAPIIPTPSEMAAEAARKFSLPESFVQSVMRAESGFNAAAISPKGALGLMQLMPGTAVQLGIDPNNPQQNAEGGAKYLRDLLARYESDPDQVLLALAAYNAGPEAVERYHGVPPYRETREYILRVLRNWKAVPQAPSGK